MFWMFKPIRAIEVSSPLWRNYGRYKPTHCPNCHHAKPWKHVGFDPDYTDRTQAKKVQCTACEARVDCVFPKWNRTLMPVVFAS